MVKNEMKTKLNLNGLDREPSQKSLAALIRDIKLKIMQIRKSQIEKELNKTKFLEEEIRKKREQIKRVHGEFSESEMMSEDDERRYERLLTAQKARANKVIKFSF